MLSTGTELVCPRGKQGEQALIIDLGAIVKAEVRQDEVQIVTPQKAPELLSEFNRAWRKLNELVVTLTNESNHAKKAVSQRKAVLLLEVVPKRLKDADLTSTADNRQAVIDLDLEYQTLSERSEYIECVIEYLRGKMKSFETALNSVKKIMSDDAFNYTIPNTKGDSGSAPPGIAGFGKSRY